jgi:integrase
MINRKTERVEMTKDLIRYEDNPFMAIDRSALSERSKYRYHNALRKFLDAYGGRAFLDERAIADYVAAAGISQSEKAHLKAAIKMVTDDLLMRWKSQANPENVQSIEAAQMRIEAVQNAFSVPRQPTSKAHVWLSVEETKALFETCDLSDLAGTRDWLALNLLAGAGLRRAEAVHVRFRDVLNTPAGPRVHISNGKGSKSRYVPVDGQFLEEVQLWRTMIQAEPEDYLLQSINRWGHIGESLSTNGLVKIVRKHGRLIGHPDLMPHDLRRTFAEAAYKAGHSLREIQLLMGHASLATTARYLNPDLDGKEPVAGLFR